MNITKIDIPAVTKVVEVTPATTTYTLEGLSQQDVDVLATLVGRCAGTLNIMNLFDTLDKVASPSNYGKGRGNLKLTNTDGGPCFYRLDKV